MAAMNGANTARRWAATVLLLSLLVSAWSCAAPTARVVDETGHPVASLDSIWELVDSAFPGGLEKGVVVRLIDKDHSGFDIEQNAVVVSRSYSPTVSRGKVCMGLTHLALHRLSGGDAQRKGRCFDDDKRFLEYAVATYMDRTAAGSIEKELIESYTIAARLFREKKMSVPLLRSWEAFCYQGRWADQFEEWNLEGLRTLLSLGHFLVNEKNFLLEDLGRVFEELASEGVTLEQAFLSALGVDMNVTLVEWREEVLEKATQIGY